MQRLTRDIFERSYEQGATGQVSQNDYRDKIRAKQWTEFIKKRMRVLCSVKNGSTASC
jgi:hypothetical protein